MRYSKLFRRLSAVLLVWACIVNIRVYGSKFQKRTFTKRQGDPVPEPSPRATRPSGIHPLLIDDPAAKTISSDPDVDFCSSVPKEQWTLWQAHVCEARSKPLQKGCMPQKRWAFNEKDAKDVKGVVLIFHGFTACPDAMQWIAHELQKEGFLTLNPLNPGHGYLTNGEACSLKGADCLRNTPAGFLPSNLETIQKYVDWAVQMTRQEVDSIPPENRSPTFTVSVFGLSFGGPLTIMAADKGKDLFKNVLSIDGFMGLQEAGIDIDRSNCLRSENPFECMQQVMAKLLADEERFEKTGEMPRGKTPFGWGKLIRWGVDLVKERVEGAVEKVLALELLRRNSNLWYTMGTAGTRIIERPTAKLWRGPLVNGALGWGAGCEENTARSGYCNFRTKNLFAITAAGFYSLSRVPHLPPSMNLAFITTERDGAGRNGLVMAAALESIKIRPAADKNIREGRLDTAAAATASTGRTSVCMFLGKPGCDLTNAETANECGMPHSCFARTEALNDYPYRMDWEAELFENVIQYVKIGVPVGETTNSRWSGSDDDVHKYCLPVPFGTVDELKGTRFDSTRISDERASLAWAVGRWQQ
ncbi:hypothetical protein HK102_011065 [Quaeritorhiza haematococci]|nr:hypothetical protein HK102_011065 [Quaeritorhiza haematococci]